MEDNFMIINHNISAMNANRRLGLADAAQSTNMEKLSSGMRINKGADDAAGLAVSEKMRAQVRGLNQGSKNIQDGISFIQTTEGYLEETTSIVQRIRELSVQAANGIYTAEDREMITIEVNQLIDETNRVASQAQFNGMTLLTGRFSANTGIQEDSPIVFHVGANMDQTIEANVGTMTAAALGMRNAASGVNIISVSTTELANRSIGVLDKSLNRVSLTRANLGAVQNRLQLAKGGVDIAAENLQATESRIRDVNMAEESISFAKNGILTQASNAMLAQANTRTQGVLQLLR